MADTATLTVRVPTGTKKRLEALAKDTKRSKSFLAAEAISNYLEIEAWQIQQIKEGIADADAGRMIPHEEVRGWIDSLGTRKKLPPPKCK
jgi:predicted transcriptional regulator